MKFLAQEEGDATDLLYFDSWESVIFKQSKWLSTLYYFSILLL